MLSVCFDAAGRGESAFVIICWNFRAAVFTAAAMSGRSVRILHQLTQPADHPVSIYHPEGEYLKGLVLYVE